MPLVQPSISNAIVKMTINEGNISPLQMPENFILSLNFASDLTALKKFAGTFTPAAGSLDIYDFASDGSDQITWAFLLCDGNVALKITAFPNFNIVTNISVNRFFLWTGPTVHTNYLRTIGIDGTTGGPPLTPMAQGVPVNWQLIMGNGTVS